MRVMWWIALLLPFAGGCAVPHFGGAFETSVAIGVCFDDGSRVKIHEAVSQQLGRQDVELVGCLGATAAAGRAPQLEWRRPREFEGVRAAAPLPQRPADARFGYSFERGPLHLTVIETTEPMTAKSPAYLWLMEDLSLAMQPWKVVILSRPIVSPSPIQVDEDRLDLAALLAREGVALALSTGGPAYFRTARIGDSRVESVRFVILGGDVAGAPLKPAPEWTVRTVTEPCFCRAEREDGPPAMDGARPARAAARPARRPRRRRRRRPRASARRCFRQPGDPGRRRLRQPGRQRLRQPGGPDREGLREPGAELHVERGARERAGAGDAG